jgi:hypothetical protein
VTVTLASALTIDKFIISTILCDAIYILNKNHKMVEKQRFIFTFIININHLKIITTLSGTTPQRNNNPIDLVKFALQAAALHSIWGYGTQLQ